MYRHAGFQTLSRGLNRWKSLGLVVAFCLLASLASAETVTQNEVAETEGPNTAREGWHVVRPGDTLEGIARKYLGEGGKWPNNWQLNPGVKDPNLIKPGQRLRVLLPGNLPPSGALVSKISNRVDDQLLPLDWREAEKNDLLQSRDSLRTAEGASAELLFYDETHLVLSESSLVVVGDEPTRKAEVDRTQIEIVLGQADLSGALPAAKNQEIEIILGGVKVEPKGNAEGKISTRTRLVGEESAQLMVYTGEGAIEAGGETVAVPEGMGSSASAGAPPSPPEELLPAATGLSPAARFRVAERRPTFSWEAVPGARDYTVEVCRDDRCGALVARATGLSGTSWQVPQDLSAEPLYWRVTATSPSGLDGYPTTPVDFEIIDRPDDVEPPAVEIVFVGPQAKVNDQIIVGPGFEIEVTATDAATGVERWWPILDGEEAVEADLSSDSWSTGEHTLEVVAVDGVGNEQRSEVSFYYDPDPPQLSWGLQGVPGEFGSDLLERYGEEGLEATQQGRQTISAGGQTWRFDSDFTQVIVKPGGRKARLADVPDKLTGDQGLWILATDKPCNGVTKLRYELEERSWPGEKRGAGVLVVDAIDCVGNRARIAWPLLSGRGR